MKQALYYKYIFFLLLLSRRVESDAADVLVGFFSLLHPKKALHHMQSTEQQESGSIRLSTSLSLQPQLAHFKFLLFIWKLRSQMFAS